VEALGMSLLHLCDLKKETPIALGMFCNDLLHLYCAIDSMEAHMRFLQLLVLLGMFCNDLLHLYWQL
jgi:hypothetical protein